VLSLSLSLSLVTLIVMQEITEAVLADFHTHLILSLNKRAIGKN